MGNYRVKVRRQPRYIDEKPVRRLHAVHRRLRVHAGQVPQPVRSRAWALRKPVWIPFPQAVPPVPVIDPEVCLQIARGKCKQGCVEACGERNAIRFDQQEKIEEYDVGAIIVATGFKAFDPSVIPYYGYGKYPNVYTSLEVERLLNAGGPTVGQARAPRRLDAQARGHHPLRGQPRRQLPRLLLARLLHVRPEARPPGPREDRGRGLQLLHRHPHAGQGIRGVLQPRAERRRAVHPRQGGRHHARPPATGTAGRRRPGRCRSTTRCWARSARSTSTW